MDNLWSTRVKSGLGTIEGVCTNGTHPAALPVPVSSLLSVSPLFLSLSLTPSSCYFSAGGWSAGIIRTAHVQLTSIQSHNGWRCVQLSPIQSRNGSSTYGWFLPRRPVPPLELSAVQSPPPPSHHALPRRLPSPPLSWQISKVNHPTAECCRPDVCGRSIKPFP